MKNPFLCTLTRKYMPLWMADKEADYAAHAINTHEAKVQGLRDALEWMRRNDEHMDQTGLGCYARNSDAFTAIAALLRAEEERK